MITRRYFIVGTASSLTTFLICSAWDIAIQRGYSPTSHKSFLDPKYLEMANKLRGRSFGSPGGPYRWRAAFEDVIGRCFEHFDEVKITDCYQYIEQFTTYVHAAREIAENRSSIEEIDEKKLALAGVVLKTVLEKDINNLIQDDRHRQVALEITKRFVNFQIPTEEFFDSELELVRKFAMESFAKRWSGYGPYKAIPSTVNR